MTVILILTAAFYLVYYSGGWALAVAFGFGSIMNAILHGDIKK